MKKEWKDRNVLYVKGDKRFLSHEGEIYGYENDFLISLKDRYLYLGANVKFLQFGIILDELDMSKLISLTENGVEVIPVKYYLTPQTFKNKKVTKKNIFEAVLKCDILILRMPSLLSYIAREAAIKYGKPYIIELIGCPLETLWTYSAKTKLLAPYSFFKCKKFVEKAEYVIYVSSEFLQKRYPNSKKTCSISNVIIQTVSEDIIQKRINRFSKEKDKITISTMAAVDVLYKGQHFVIEAIAKLKNKGYTFEYHIAGQGNQDRLIRIAEHFGIADQVIFEGTLGTEQVYELLDNTDIYIQPSLTEGLPRAVVEAMSRGCVCVGSNIGSIQELLDEICLFKSGNVNQIIRILEKFVKDKNLLIQQSKINFTKAKNFHKELIDKKRIKFYDEFISDNF